MGKLDISFSKRLKSVADKRGLNNKQFANLVDISENATTNYLTKGRVPEAYILIRISRELQVSIDWLLSGEEALGTVNDTPNTGHTGPIAIETLAAVIKGVEDYLMAGKRELNPETKSRLISLLYEHFTKTSEEPNQKTIVSYLKLVA